MISSFVRALIAALKARLELALGKVALRASGDSGFSPTSAGSGFRLPSRFQTRRGPGPQVLSSFVFLDTTGTLPTLGPVANTDAKLLIYGLFQKGRVLAQDAVAEMERLHHSTVKALDKLYMQEQVDRAGLPAPWAIGIDEISIRKGHNYRVIVSDLERARPIWVGGEGRKETDIDLFFKALGEKKSARIKLAAMDMWKPFRNSVINNAPHARIIFDKFHIMRHLSKALDEVRRSEYKRLSGEDRSYIKGQRYTLLSRRENLSLDGRRALKKLLQANRRLNTAYILKEAFGQLWDYRTERGARAFFTRWKDSLKWQRLHPYQKFAEMIEAHWDGIASYCHPENKGSLGLVEGVNNKIRVLQRRAYGYRDNEYLKLKIVAAFLPPLPRNAVFNPHESA